MAFKFNWTTFDKKFIDEAQSKLTEALNKGITNQMIGTIKVDELNMGTKAPELEVMEIGDLSEEKFKGIFKITYQGDAYIVIRATVQINPLIIPKTPITLSMGSGIIAADQPLPIPVKLRISNLKLSGIAALGFSNKGITFCFKNDPLEDINVSSTFDRIQAIKKLIEHIIKTQISAFLLEDVPELIHNFSKSNNQSSSLNNTSHSRSYSGETYIPSSPSYTDSIGGSSIYGDDINGSFCSNQTLVDEENDIMGWRRKWIGNDFNDSNITFDNRIILYRGLKCLKSVNANRGVLRLLNPSLNNYVCQSIHIDSWLITPPFSPIPLYIPKASYPLYTKDKHFSIVDYLRRTAITRTTNYQHQKTNSIESVNIDINSVENPFKRLQQTNETTHIPSPTISPITSPRIISNSNSDVSFSEPNEDLSNNSHNSYNYTHTYHRGHRKSKSMKKYKTNLSYQSSSSLIVSDIENDFSFSNRNEDINKPIPKNSYGVNSRGHTRVHSNQTNSTEISVSNKNNNTINNDNVFLSLLNSNNNNTMNSSSAANIYSRNNTNRKVSSSNSNSGYNSDGESTVCEEFPAEIVIEPSNNSMAAQLTNLMNSNQTISPYTRTLEHFAYRSFPHSKSNYKRRSNRQRHRLKIHVDGLMGSSSTITTINQDVKSQTS
ncbi:hypothetical protein BCR36DRAFT_579684 [Piromyces finnis]|uniref:SMP-LTD domain-containing protein n=1 Tax=Piromyces finnis TaxID=1754191 RepID=A0A1Y1VMT3_9FUNG|nr:hypothetical protein BCR36DRAFT_579684 [Piromyces finnis]|eukprot:ORX60224.1 hypothetical protein BCR36DRAFT_579684 [Piromyces finnis]